MNLSFGMLKDLLWVFFFLFIFIGVLVIIGELWNRFLDMISGKNRQRRPKETQKSHEKKLKKLDKVYGTYSIQKIDRMNGREFELFTEKLFRVLEKDNIQKTEFTPASGDQGCDVVIRYRDGSLLGIQCKRYSNKVDNKAVQNIVTAKAMYGLTQMMVITNNYYQPSAIEAARSNRVELVNRDQLKEMINRYNDTIQALHAKN